MLSWLKFMQKQDAPVVAMPIEAPEPALAPRPVAEDFDGIWLGVSQLSSRIRHLVQYALNAESTHAGSIMEVEERLGAMRLEITNAMAKMEHGISNAEDRRIQSVEQLKSAMQTIESGLGGLDQSLARKIAEIGNVVDVLERIGKELDLLALNAAIQSAAAGEVGRPFGVVSDHIRGLARDTVANAKQVSALLDFSIFQKQLAEFSRVSGISVHEVDNQTYAAFDAVSDAFDELRMALEKVDEHSKVVVSMQSVSRGALGRQRAKAEWARDIARTLAEATITREPQFGLQRVLSDQCVHAAGYDRLEAIRSRNRLRVAIEPSFKGLSFRLRPGEPLRGLDVDYATSFARWLGVQVEFVEYPWDQCTELLYVGRRPQEQEVDLVWSALPPNAAYEGVAFSDSYTYLNYVLARRVNDTRINGLPDLSDKVVGCINDPAAFATLEAAGLRWSKHSHVEPGKTRVANLIGFSDQSVIHDALADGVVDAFAADQPIFAWACYGEGSPWRGKIEILPENLAPEPWYYAVGTADGHSSYHLLAAVNRFLSDFKKSQERKEIEMRWQFTVIDGTRSYRDEPGHLHGEAALAEA
ncbi:MAG TPA: transporter substrate-binding domain-containing protein [Novimethylophilus sp.]|jgi:ABC-type amino acid transport substrate-binding protein|uniref:methyl-accepting chemotaxis protein n=1 Tax=Novimethylophilus sp. TaxID=2137426 RepID=UPI002F4228B2